VRFCPWYPLAAAADRTPAAAGIFQVRVVTGLIAYPRGRSAMVHYGWDGADLRAAVLAFAADHPGAYLCRHAEEMSADEVRYPRGACERLREQFIRRFGAPPLPPS